MRRRDLLSLAFGVAAFPLFAVRAQQKAMPVIGILAAASPDNAGAQRMLAAFRKGLGEFGYVEGRNVTIEYRWADGLYDRLPILAADLADRKVEVIMTEGGEASVLAAKNATSTIPIVFHTNADPVAMGLIASLARPGGNLTGVSLHGLAAKRIELLSELVPQARVIAVLVNPNDPFAGDEIRDAQEAARIKGVQLRVAKAGSDSDIEPAFARLSEMELRRSLSSPRRYSAADFTDRSAGVALRDPGHLFRAARCRGRRPAELCIKPRGSIPSERDIHWKDFEWRQARRPAGAATDQIRAGDQSENREGAWPHCAALNPRPRRRGHRMNRRLVIESIAG